MAKTSKKVVAKSAPKSTKKASTKKASTKKASTKKASNGAPKKDGYKGHRDGSSKAKAHEIFDKYLKNPEKAKELASKLKIKPNTVNSWFSEFRNS